MIEIAASHVGVFGSPQMGKTWYLTHSFQKQIFFSFVNYSRLENHLKDITKNGKNVEVLILDELSVKKYPEKSKNGKIDVLVIDCSSYKPRSMKDEEIADFQKWLIATQMKNTEYYTTMTIDEAHNVLHSYSRTSGQSIYLDHFLEARNYGHRTVLGTQKPQLISPSAYDMFQTIVCFKITGKNGVKAVNEALEYWGVETFIEDNKKLNKYEYNVYNSIE